MIEINDHPRHTLTLENREKLTVSGVEDVLNFDEGGVVLKTVMGVLTVEGNGMRIINLNVDTKEIEIEGTVYGMMYSGERGEGRERGRLFRRKA